MWPFKSKPKAPLPPWGERLCSRNVRRLPCSWPMRLKGIAVGTWGPTPRYFALWSCPDGHSDEVEISEATVQSWKAASANKEVRDD